MTRALPFLLISSALLTFGCDHGTKHLAKTHLEGRAPLELWPGVLQLRYTENTDSAFSLLGRWLETEARYVALTALALLGVAVFALFVFRRWEELAVAQRFGAAVVIAGGLANVVERALRGYVIDFLHVPNWPVFNVADIAICVGFVLLVLLGPAKPAARSSPAS